jgi:hypothetical protein
VDTPQPLPLLRGELIEEESFFEPEAQLKINIILFMLLDAHLGHTTSVSVEDTPCRTENFSSHLKHIYS